MIETTKPERRFQFSLRKALLWTTVVGLGLGVASVLGWGAVNRVLYPSWLVVVVILRLGFGSEFAASVSVVAGLLLYEVVGGQVLLADSMAPAFAEVVLIALVGGFLGGFVGFLVFLLAEATCRIVNWLDRIGHSDE